MEYTIKQLADHAFPRPPAGGRGPGGRGRSCRKHHGQGVAPAQGRRGASKTPPPRRSAARQRHDKHRRARPTEGGGQGQGRDPARRRGDPRQPTGNHARDRDQGGAGGQQTATAYTSRGDLRTRPHTDEVLTRLRGKTTVPGAARQRRRDPVRPRIVKNTRGRYQPPSPHRCICSSHGFQMNPMSVYRSATYSTQAWQTSAGCIMSYSGRRVPCATAWHRQQRVIRFCGKFVPPCPLLTTWWTCKPCSESHSAHR